MSNVNSNFFSKIDSVDAQRESEWLRAGRYIAYIKGLKARTTRAGAQATFLELIIVAVLDDSGAANEPKGAHRVGDKATQYYGLNKDAAWPALKAHVAAIMGCQPDKITSEVLAECCSEDQPLEGMVIEVDGQIIMTQKSNRPFNKVTIKRRLEKAEVEEIVAPAVIKSLGLELI